MLKSILLVAFGGGLGSVLRFLTNIIVAKNYPAKAHYATFIVNSLGCLLIGLFMGYLIKQSQNEYLKLLLITGFCGGFTTFSAFGLENYTFINSQNLTIALIYTALSVIIGILFVGLGIYIVK
jgi:CrcB protein